MVKSLENNRLTLPDFKNYRKRMKYSDCSVVAGYVI
jgi:hypothetical protein